MKTISSLFVALTLSLTANAQTSSSNYSAGKISQTDNLAAKSRAEALQTEAIFYSLPRNDMSFMSIGAATQRQTFKAGANDNKLNHQAFNFMHSRGLSDEFALDFDVNYLLRDETSTFGNTGVGHFSVGGRSHFEELGLNWVYGGGLMYLPDGEYGDSSSKMAVRGQIGFEESVDIARWGVAFEGTSEDTVFFQNQTYFVGFFEMPFIKDLKMGVSGGLDPQRLSQNEQNNFAKIYAQYALDSVSAVQAKLTQSNQKKDDQTATDAEVGISLNRVF